MHGPFSKILGARPPAPRIDAPGCFASIGLHVLGQVSCRPRDRMMYIDICAVDLGTAYTS